MKQRTVQQKFTLEGIGLHTGESIQLTGLPSEINSGINFKRVDLENAPIVPAIVTNVGSTYRSTCLKKGETHVHTTEHILSALAGLGVDNLTIELNGPEIPILDGSAKPFVDAIMGAGIEDQDAEKEFISFNRRLDFKDPDSGAEYTYIPNNEGDPLFEYTSIIEYSSKVGTQVAMYRPDIPYESEIAPSRTFVFVNELEDLAEKGVIKGGSVDNAIIFSHEDFPKEKVKTLAEKFNVSEDVLVNNGILNGLTLFYQNEPARHKLLDLIGDLYLLRKPIEGKIIARKPGHTGNVAFAKFLRAEFQKDKKLGGLPIYDPTKKPIIDITEIKKLIPHRYPFLLVDKIIELGEGYVVGVKNVTGNEEFFQGHFPDNPVFPGVLQMEALAQTGGIMALVNEDQSEEWDTYFLKMDNVKFKSIVRPGDTLILKMKLLTPVRRGIYHMKGTAYVGDTLVSEGELTAQIIKREQA